jgi:deoxyhypusine synthase
MAPTFVGDFHLDGAGLRKQGLNRIGNLIIPNNNYCLFEEWVMPILDSMLEEQKRTAGSKDPMIWTPQKMIARLGKEINNEDSVYYWCWKNDIPVFCPAITDGSLGDMLYFHSFRNPGLIVDIAQDIRNLNSHTVFEKKTGQIILGGGVVKHHICNANLMRNGADWSVFINTGQEFDGSDSGARPDEATSWGKIRLGVEGVKVYSEATLVFPTIVAMTFAKYKQEQDALKQQEQPK